MPVIPWVERKTDPALQSELITSGIAPLMARVLAARQGHRNDMALPLLQELLPLDTLKGVSEAAGYLADAVEQGRKILVVADYDADGATACAVALKALRAMGGVVDYFVPNRMTLGYGLTPAVVEAVLHREPRLLLTVDNGISSVEGVEAANRHGIPVIVTDHHLPGLQLPDALAIVNPNQPGCGFASKHMAGVGVLFYTMLAVRAELRRRGRWQSVTEPSLGGLLDLVALGTVADVVRLDRNNRLLVQAGLRLVRSGRANPGIRALCQVAGRVERELSSTDLGFFLGPRLNAAGRMEDMTHGIECLVCGHLDQALPLAQRLDEFNRDRRQVEGTIQEEALAELESTDVHDRYSLVLFDERWHPGVVGIVASRLKDRYHRPVVVFSRGTQPGEIRGSGRSIRGFHLRDAIERVATRIPGLVLRFGGHSAAAGLSLQDDGLSRFAECLEDVARDMLGPEDLELEVEHDGVLAAEDMTLPVAETLKAQVWGQGFPEPLFFGRFSVRHQRIVGERHLKVLLACEGREFDGICFGQGEPVPDTIEVLYRLSVNEWRGERRVQVEVCHWRV